jgi:hypothetical protein
VRGGLQPYNGVERRDGGICVEFLELCQLCGSGRVGLR